MKRKLRIFSCIAVICLSVCMFAFGVYAASTVSVTTSGTVSFVADGVYATVTRRVTGNVGDDIVNGPVTIGSDATSPVVMGDNEALEFESATTSIVMTFTIKNEATEEGRVLYATLIDNENVAPNNVSIVSDELGSEIEVAPGQTKTIVITLSVQDPNVSAFAEYDYTISLKNSSTFVILDDTNANFVEMSLIEEEKVYKLQSLKDNTLTNIVIPAEHNGFPVMYIGADAFKNNTAIQSINIPDSVYDISNTAFDGTNLVFVENGLKYVKTTSSQHHIVLGEEIVDSLTEFNLPTDTKVIADSAFLNALSNVSGPLVFPDGLIAIGTYAFYNHYNGDTNNHTSPKVKHFTSIELNDNLKYVGSYGLAGLVNVCQESLTIPDSVEYLQFAAFYLLGDNKTYDNTSLTLNIGSGLTYLNVGVFESSAIARVFVPGNIKTIYGYCFIGCTNLNWVQLEDGVESLGAESNGDSVFGKKDSNDNRHYSSFAIGISSTVNYMGPRIFQYRDVTVYCLGDWDELISNSHEDALKNANISLGG